MLISSAGLRRQEAACEHARGGGGRREEGARGPETDDQAEMLEVFEPLPHPFAHLAHTPSLWVVSIALAEAWGGGQHRGRSLHELTRPLIQGRFHKMPYL